MPQRVFVVALMLIFVGMCASMSVANADVHSDYAEATKHYKPRQRRIRQEDQAWRQADAIMPPIAELTLEQTKSLPFSHVVRKYINRGRPFVVRGAMTEEIHALMDSSFLTYDESVAHTNTFVAHDVRAGWTKSALPLLPWADEVRYRLGGTAWGGAKNKPGRHQSMHRDRICSPYFALQLSGSKRWMLESRDDVNLLNFEHSAQLVSEGEVDGPRFRNASASFHDVTTHRGDMLFFGPYLLHGTENMEHASFSMHGEVGVHAGEGAFVLPAYCPRPYADGQTYRDTFAAGEPAVLKRQTAASVLSDAERVKYPTYSLENNVDTGNDDWYPDLDIDGGDDDGVPQNGRVRVLPLSAQPLCRSRKSLPPLPPQHDEL